MILTLSVFHSFRSTTCVLNLKSTGAIFVFRSCVRSKLLSYSGSTEQNDFSSSRVAYIVEAMRWIYSLRAQISRRIFWLILESSVFLFRYRTYYWTSSHRTSSEVNDVRWTASCTRRQVDDVICNTWAGRRQVHEVRLKTSGRRHLVHDVRCTTSGNTKRGTLSIIIIMIYSD